MGLLEGIRVIELGNLISAAYCTRLLADLGAEVIKLEHPESGDESRKHGPFAGDVPDLERSGLYLSLNVNKLGITLDVTKAAGREILLKLLGQSDILVENLSLTEMSELRLNYTDLCEQFPRLIVTTITPFGQTGPYKAIRAEDINICAAAGISIRMGTSRREPLTAPFSQAAYQGGIAGGIGSICALFARDFTGTGQLVDISEADVLATIHTGLGMIDYIFRGAQPRRTGRRLEDTTYPHTRLPCKDGWVCAMAPEGHQWRRFLELIGNPPWSKAPRFQDRITASNLYADELDALLAPWLNARTKEEIFEECRQAKVPFAPVRTIDEVASEPHFEERGFLIDVTHPVVGTYKVPGLPCQIKPNPSGTWRAAPLLGEDNELIYCSRLGFSKKELLELQKMKII